MSNELMQSDAITGDLITDVDGGGGMIAFAREEIDMQIATAKRFPRSIKNFRNNVLDMACLDQSTAETMFYALPRSGKNIVGPSARFAEVVGAAYGNLRYGARIIGIEGNFIVAEGACFDVEKNIAATVQVRRRITDKNGKKFGDDMIQVTGMAASSIALRNAIFKVVPMGLVKDIFEQAKQTSLGKSKSLKDTRNAAVEHFGKLGVTPEQILEALGREGIDDITNDDLIVLRGLINTIKEGEITIEEAFDKVSEKRGLKRQSIDEAMEQTPKPSAAKKPAKAEDKPSAAVVADDLREQYLEALDKATTKGSLESLRDDIDSDDRLPDSLKQSLLGEISDRLDVLSGE